ncbi:hypothetical protein OAU99_01625 [Candidatus Poseidoniaceae archaeon]|jgi:hypothetical protein|nr:hypothetical protein [Candidatus Poseidoniaceae archaeon]
MESESLQLHTIAKSYDRLIEVPQDLLLPPEPTIIKEAKKIEIRLMLEASLIILSGIIPPGLVALYFNF